MTLRRLWCLLLFLSACDKKPPPPVLTSASPAEGRRPQTDPSATSSVKPNSVAVPSAPPPQASGDDPRLALIIRWNQLLATRDSESLRSVYGSSVVFYGKKRSREAVVAAKAAALSKSPDYTQSIGPITLERKDATHFRALFDKQWSIAGRTQRVNSSLLLAEESGSWLIVEETDRKTENYIAGRAERECWEFVASAVASTKEASSILNGPTNPDAGHASNGLRVMFSDTEPTADVDVHESHTDYVVPLAWFEVNLESGSVMQRSSLSEEIVAPKRLVTNSAVATRMKAACRKQVELARRRP